MNQWGLQEEKEEERASGEKSNLALGEPAYPFVVQAAVGGKEKPLVLLGMKKRWHVYDAEMPERCQRVSTKASLISFTRAITMLYTSMVLLM